MTTPANPVPASAAPPPVVRFIVLTGTSGIGRATVVRLASAGYVVFVAGRRAGALRARAGAPSGGIRPVVLDVTDSASIDRARQPIPDQTDGHGLDVLVNAAKSRRVGRRHRRAPGRSGAGAASSRRYDHPAGGDDAAGRVAGSLPDALCLHLRRLERSGVGTFMNRPRPSPWPS
jgi:NAD(P)-dependent dehydrogenase (short-subunit alcohol dehydrogenase family)